MKTRRLFGLIGAAALTLGVFGGSGSVASAAAAKPLVVGTDAVGDWGQSVDPTVAPVGDALGQDLTSASISSDGKNVNFVIGLNSLPPNGGIPEFTRYTWDFQVGKEFRELDGKWLNYSRGTCDPTAGHCPPPRDPGQQPFILRGNCSTDTTLPLNLTTCEELALLKAVFDPAAATITISVPFETLGVKKGTKITPGTNIFGGSISASPSAFLTNNSMPMDTLTVVKAFTVK